MNCEHIDHTLFMRSILVSDGGGRGVNQQSQIVASPPPPPTKRNYFWLAGRQAAMDCFAGVMRVVSTMAAARSRGLFVNHAFPDSVRKPLSLNPETFW